MKYYIIPFISAIFCFLCFHGLGDISYANDLKTILQKAGVNTAEQAVPIPKIDNKFTTESKIFHIIYTTIKFLLIASGIIAVLLVVYGGFLYTTALISSEAPEKGKKTIIGAIIGLLVVLFSYAILTNVANFFEFVER